MINQTDERQEQAEDRFYFETEREAINYELGDLQGLDDQNVTQWEREISREDKLSGIDTENRELHEVLELIEDFPY